MTRCFDKRWTKTLSLILCVLEFSGSVAKRMVKPMGQVFTLEDIEQVLYSLVSCQLVDNQFRDHKSSVRTLAVSYRLHDSNPCRMLLHLKRTGENYSSQADLEVSLKLSIEDFFKGLCNSSSISQSTPLQTLKHSQNQ